MSRRRLILGVTAWSAVGLGVLTVIAVHAYDKTAHSFSDWVVFEVGARILVHYDYMNLYSGPRFHLYADNAVIQVGPPALWFVAAFQALNARTVYWIFTVIITVITTVGGGAAWLAGRELAQRNWDALRRWAIFPVTAILTVGILVNWGDRWKHLDDVMALTFAALAALLIAKHRWWLVIGLLLGTGVAAKPWALILTPMLLALPRRDIARTTLATIIVAGAWWAPFVIADPNTTQALGHWQIKPNPGSVLYLIGIHGPVERWLRPVQFFLGLGVGTFVCRRRFWLAAPLAALATRVLTDPYAYGYYGTGPLLFAFLYDCAGKGWRGLPTFTAFTAAIEFLLPNLYHQQTVLAISKAVWAITILGVVLRPSLKAGSDDLHEGARDRLPEPLADASPA